ncbi:unnamed protein product [Hymenolepis diminuta]|uniref:Uncharacterized protein n=1 Tax=Hymenolepis diminuta TaxID=6216 RepID=A0A564YPL9_HYMDI|nr:unnamed protein product [Hymenolepis diminuta]
MFMCITLHIHIVNQKYRFPGFTTYQVGDTSATSGAAIKNLRTEDGNLIAPHTQTQGFPHLLVSD